MANIYQEFLDAKAKEKAATEARIACEQKIINELGAKAEGSKTHTVGEFKVTITGKVNRTLDQAAWETVRNEIPEDLQPVEYKPKVIDKGARYLQNNEPEVYKKLCEAMTVKPGKTSVAVTYVLPCINQR